MSSNQKSGYICTGDTCIKVTNPTMKSSTPFGGQKQVSNSVDTTFNKMMGVGPKFQPFKPPVQFTIFNHLLIIRDQTIKIFVCI